MTDALAVVGIDGKPTVVTIEVDDPGPGEVLVDLKASGVCHTDHDMLGLPMPFVMGHEGAGVVGAIGEGVTGVAVGDRVVLNWAISCGTCANCVGGVRHLCLNGSPIAGGMKGHADFNRSRYNGIGVYRAFNLGTMSTKTVVKAAAVTKDLDRGPHGRGVLSRCRDRGMRSDDGLGLSGERGAACAWDRRLWCWAAAASGST